MWFKGVFLVTKPLSSTMLTPLLLSTMDTTSTSLVVLLHTVVTSAYLSVTLLCPVVTTLQSSDMLLWSVVVSLQLIINQLSSSLHGVYQLSLGLSGSHSELSSGFGGSHSELRLPSAFGLPAPSVSVPVSMTHGSTVSTESLWCLFSACLTIDVLWVLVLGMLVLSCACALEIKWVFPSRSWCYTIVTHTKSPFLNPLKF
jgi:hypothetical protein